MKKICGGQKNMGFYFLDVKKYTGRGGTSFSQLQASCGNIVK